MFRQIITPNLDPYMYDDSGNLLRDWLGWCGNYVRTCFNVARKIPRAWQSWLQSPSRHENRNFPVGVYFPIFFRYTAKLDNSGDNEWGHEAIAFVTPEGTMNIWSSPITRKPFADTWSSIGEVERNYSSTFVGWAEHVNGERVIDWIDDVPPPAPTPTYQVMETYPQGKQVKLNKNPTNLWGMNYADPGSLPPVEVHSYGEIVADISNRVRHKNGYEYYRRADQVDGFNVADCDDYTPPPPPIETPPVIPDPPVTAPSNPLPTEQPTSPVSPDPTPEIPPAAPIISPPAKRSWLVRLLIRLFPSIFH